jgi:hypothetical protein
LTFFGLAIELASTEALQVEP